MGGTRSHKGSPILPGRDPFSVLIAGGGVAAIEAALARESSAKARSRCSCSLQAELLVPARRRRGAVRAGQGAAFDLGHVADAAGAGFALGALTAVDGARNEARTDAGTTIP